MKVLLDRDACSSIGMCESQAPEVFEVTDAGELVVLVPEPDESQREAVEAACAACPTGALSLQD